jgi:hypothetical protein
MRLGSLTNQCCSSPPNIDIVGFKGGYQTSLTEKDSSNQVLPKVVQGWPTTEQL